MTEVPRRWSTPDPASAAEPPAAVPPAAVPPAAVPPATQPPAAPVPAAPVPAAPVPAVPPAAPPASGYGPPPSYPSGHDFAPAPHLRSISGLGTVLIVLGGLWTVLQVLTALAAQPAQHRYAQAAAAGEDPAWVFTAYDLIALPGFGMLVALWVVGSLWLSGAYDNASALAAHRLRRRKAWVWLGWWVPVVSLWFPKTIVDDAWSVTSGRGAVSRQKHTGLWWGLWLATNVLMNGPTTATFGATQLSDTTVILEWVLAAVMVVAFFAWVPIVRGLSAAQEELVHSRFAAA